MYVQRGFNCLITTELAIDSPVATQFLRDKKNLRSVDNIIRNSAVRKRRKVNQGLHTYYPNLFISQPRWLAGAKTSFQLIKKSQPFSCLASPMLGAFDETRLILIYVKLRDS